MLARLAAVTRALVAYILVLPTPALAQLPAPVPAAPLLAPGTRLRVSFVEDSRTGPLVGRLVRHDDTHLQLGTRAREWTLSWKQLAAVEVSHRRSVAKAAGQGAVVGALIFVSTVAVMAIVHAPSRDPRFEEVIEPDTGPSVGTVLVRAGLLGAGVGTVAGATLIRERWEPVTMPEPAAR